MESIEEPEAPEGSKTPGIKGALKAILAIAPESIQGQDLETNSEGDINNILNNFILDIINSLYNKVVKNYIKL